MKKRTILKALVMTALALGGVARVNAQPFVLGDSGFTDQLIVGTASGAITLDTSEGEINAAHGLNQGWWANNDFNPNTIGNNNVYIGNANGANLNDFNVFDLDGLNGATATSATLVLYEGFDSGTPPFNLSFWDVTTPLATLVNTVGFSAAIDTDLGSGIEYGSLAYPGGASQIDVTLDAAALANINAGGTSGYFAVGGTLAPGTSIPPSVPDGGTTLSLLGMCVTGLLGLKRKNK